jgi:pyruvate kinase
MLSAETATGQYPVEAVEIMNRIAFETEESLPPYRMDQARAVPDAAITQAAVEAAGFLASRVQATLVVAATQGGHTALAMSKQRNSTPTLGLSDQTMTVRRMCLYWGVIPVEFRQPHVPEDYVQAVTAWAGEHGLVRPGDRLVFVFGSHWADSNYNTILVHEVT